MSKVLTTVDPASKAVVHAVRHRVSRIRKPLINRRPDCPRCQLDDLELELRLHEARQIIRKEPRDKLLAQLLAGTGISPAEEAYCHQRHRLPQPVPNSARIAGMQQTANRVLTRVPIRSEILDLIARARWVSIKQIADIFYSGSLSDYYATMAARKTLRVLAAHHLVYPVWITIGQRGDPEEVWGLGHAGAEWMSRRSGYAWDWPTGPDNFDYSWDHPKSPADLGSNSLYHDLQVHDLAIKPILSAGDCDLQGVTVRVSISPKNYFTAHQLEIAISDQEQWVKRLKAKGLLKGRANFVYASADAVIGVGVDLPQQHPQLPVSSFHPLVLESDSGTKDVSDVANQVIAHCFLAMSGNVGQRFPQLLDGGPTPVCFVFEHEFLRPDLAHTRMKRIFEVARERLQAIGYPHHPPIFAVYRPEWLQNGLESKTYGLWADDAQWASASGFSHLTAVSRLVAGNVPLNQRHQLPSTTVLEINPPGAIKQSSFKQAKTERAAKAKSMADLLEDRVRRGQEKRAAVPMSGEAVPAGGEVR